MEALYYDGKQKQVRDAVKIPLSTQKLQSALLVPVPIIVGNSWVVL